MNRRPRPERRNRRGHRKPDEPNDHHNFRGPVNRRPRPERRNRRGHRKPDEPSDHHNRRGHPNPDDPNDHHNRRGHGSRRPCPGRRRSESRRKHGGRPGGRGRQAAPGCRPGGHTGLVSSRAGLRACQTGARSRPSGPVAQRRDRSGRCPDDCGPEDRGASRGQRPWSGRCRAGQRSRPGEADGRKQRRARRCGAGHHGPRSRQRPGRLAIPGRAGDRQRAGRHPRAPDGHGRGAPPSGRNQSQARNGVRSANRSLPPGGLIRPRGGHRRSSRHRGNCHGREPPARPELAAPPDQSLRAVEDAGRERPDRALPGLEPPERGSP